MSAASSSAELCLKSRRWNDSSSGKNSLSLKASLVSKRMAQHDVAEFVGQHHGQGSFVGKHVEQAAADDDGVADGERLQGRGQQDAAVDVSLQVDVVGDQQIVDDGSQNLVDFSRRSEQADFLQALDGVLFRLPFPHALGHDGSGVGGGFALVLHRLRRIDQNLGELLVLAQAFQVIAPEAGLRLEVQSLASGRS